MSCHGPKLVKGQKADVRELGREGTPAGVLGPQLPEGRARCHRGVHRVVTLNHNSEHAIAAHAIGQPARVGLFHDTDCVARVVRRLAAEQPRIDKQQECTLTSGDREFPFGRLGPAARRHASCYRRYLRLAAGVRTGEPGSGVNMPTGIGRDDLQKLTNQGAQLVEVLPTEDYDCTHLPDAINVPVETTGHQHRSAGPVPAGHRVLPRLVLRHEPAGRVAARSGRVQPGV